MKTRRHHRRVGFSLLEIMVVLAVFVMMASLSVPLLLRSFTGQSLRTGADIVRASFGEARVKAIDSGDVYAFFYLPGGSDFFIAPMVLGFRSQLTGQPIAVKQSQLPDNIVFAAGETVWDARSLQESENATFDMSSMRPVLFYPDGTSQDATIVLQNKTGAIIQVNLRGLTGVSNSSGIMTPEEIR